MSQAFQLTDADTAEIDRWILKYPADQKRSAVMAALMVVQDNHEGWLSTEAMDAVAEYLDMPKIAVYEVASFYSMYELKPVGRHKVCVCTNISCMLQGAEEIVQAIKDRYNIGLNETTPDGRFTLKAVECLGACVNAPVVQVNKTYHEKLDAPETLKVIEGLE